MTELKYNAVRVKVEVENIMKLKVEDQDGNSTTLTVKRNIPMVKIMNSYCNSKGVALKYFKVLVDGDAITDLELTPAQLELTEEDIVEVFLHCEAGGWHIFLSNSFGCKKLKTR